MKKQKFWLEEFPWPQGGLGPVELGPWDEDTRDEYFRKGVQAGRVYSKQSIKGRPGILWWKRGHYGYNPVFGPWFITLERAREIQEVFTQRNGKAYHLFNVSVNNSMYRHRHLPDPARLRYMPWDEWCDYSPKGPLTPSKWDRGVESFWHWKGLGKGAVGLEDSIRELNRFAYSHMYTTQLGPRGANFFAYSFAIPNVPELEPGLVLVGRGVNARTAATGNNYGNGCPSTLFQVGAGNPTPAAAMFETAVLLHEDQKWGLYSPHSKVKATACPGDPIRAALAELNQ